MEFGATYHMKTNSLSSKIKALRNSKGSFGVKLNKKKTEIFELIPKYARVNKKIS